MTRMSLSESLVLMINIQDFLLIDTGILIIYYILTINLISNTLLTFYNTQSRKYSFLG